MKLIKDYVEKSPSISQKPMALADIKAQVHPPAKTKLNIPPNLDSQQHSPNTSYCQYRGPETSVIVNPALKFNLRLNRIKLIN